MSEPRSNAFSLSVMTRTRTPRRCASNNARVMRSSVIVNTHTSALQRADAKR